ncbi:MAG: radical SAM protein [Candidatus Methanomethylicia archaeon]
MTLYDFVINPSINVSPYCYSILRLDPYQSCSHRCIYCFGRWYRTPESYDIKPIPNIIESFKRILKFLNRNNLKIIPFRLSTLIDPFQNIEEDYRVSRKIINLCLNYDIPLIINTKAILPLKSDYLNLLEKLNEKGIVIVQISFSTLNDDIAKVLEPNTPPPISRLNMIEKLSSENIPVIVRLQPFIPGISDYEIEKSIEEFKYAGAKQIIVEVLRDEIENLKVYMELAYDKSIYENLDEWSSYSPSVEVPSKIVRPSINWKIKIYSKIRELCVKYGLQFSTCKEGFYDYHTASNCCGMQFIDSSKYIRRPTLYEAWIYYKTNNKLPNFKELVDSLNDSYIFGDEVKRYPKLLKKKIKSHEKILCELLNERRNELINLLPTININLIKDLMEKL